MFDPYFLDSRWTLRVNGYSLSQQFIEEEYQRGGSVAVGRYLDRRDDWRLEFDYTFEDTGLNSIDAYKSRVLGGQLYRNGLTSTGGISLLVDKRNNRINATKGVYAIASANLSGGFRVNDEEVFSVFGGEFNFLETRFNIRAYQPLVESERLIFRYNGTIGSIHSTDGSIVPYIHRYRAGGSTLFGDMGGSHWDHLFAHKGIFRPINLRLSVQTIQQQTLVLLLVELRLGSTTLKSRSRSFQQRVFVR